MGECVYFIYLCIVFSIGVGKLSGLRLSPDSQFLGILEQQHTFIRHQSIHGRKLLFGCDREQGTPPPSSPPYLPPSLGTVAQVDAIDAGSSAAPPV